MKTTNELAVEIEMELCPAPAIYACPTIPLFYVTYEIPNGTRTAMRTVSKVRHLERLLSTFPSRAYWIYEESEISTETGKPASGHLPKEQIIGGWDFAVGKRLSWLTRWTLPRV